MPMAEREWEPTMHLRWRDGVLEQMWTLTIVTYLHEWQGQQLNSPLRNARTEEDWRPVRTEQAPTPAEPR